MSEAVSSPSVALPFRILLLAATYVILAKAGLLVATVGNSVTLVWPPTGLALAALLLGTRRAWPGSRSRVTESPNRVNVKARNVPYPWFRAGISVGIAF
jgi:hypothetical protein